MPAGWLQATTDWDKYYAGFDQIIWEDSDGLQEEATEEAEEGEKEKQGVDDRRCSQI
jgi:hypothetical protein